jgi:hypothetical protein
MEQICRMDVVDESQLKNKQLDNPDIWFLFAFLFFTYFSYSLLKKKRTLQSQKSVDEGIMIELQVGSDKLRQMSKFFLAYPLVELCVADLVFHSMFDSFYSRLSFVLFFVFNEPDFRSGSNELFRVGELECFYQFYVIFPK